jgi:hypothetical protein
MADGTIEIIDGKARRRRWSVTEKLSIVADNRERPSAFYFIRMVVVGWLVGRRNWPNEYLTISTS